MRPSFPQKKSFLVASVAWPSTPSSLQWRTSSGSTYHLFGQSYIQGWATYGGNAKAGKESWWRSFEFCFAPVTSTQKEAYANHFANIQT